MEPPLESKMQWSFTGRVTPRGSCRAGSGKGDPARPDPCEFENLQIRPAPIRVISNIT